MAADEAVSLSPPWSHGWIVGGWFGFSVGWLVGPFSWLDGFISWLSAWFLVVPLANQSVGWLISWLIGWLVDWLVGWWIGWLVR